MGIHTGKMLEFALRRRKVLRCLAIRHRQSHEGLLVRTDSRIIQARIQAGLTFIPYQLLIETDA